jgi:hypothetical protein
MARHFLTIAMNPLTSSSVGGILAAVGNL